VEASTRVVRVRRRPARTRRLVVRWTVLGLAVLLAAAVITGLALAGSSGRLAGGVRVAGVDVSGLSPGEARLELRERARQLANVPVVFRSESHAWAVRPSRLGIAADWNDAVATAQQAGDGFAPIRGLRRLRLSVFGQDVTPQAQAWQPALAYWLQ